MTRNSSPKIVAIVDDDRSVQGALKDLMESSGISAQCFGSAEEFLQSDQRSQTACIIADVRMPGMSGLELQESLNAEGSRIPMIFITGHDDAKTKMRAMKAGAVEFLFKPFDDDFLLEKLRAVLGR
ncbi:MAG TPA: response regulator [Blastocatellia bacterium]